MSHYQELDIMTMAQSVANGCTGRFICPDCRGGRSTEQSFNVTVSRDGTQVAYMCHRGSCGFRGVLGGNIPRRAEHNLTLREHRPYTGPCYTLPTETLAFLAERYGMPVTAVERHIKAGEAPWYVLPMADPTGRIRGHGIRWPWKLAGKPTAQPKYRCILGRPDEIALAWYPANSLQTVLVEDQLSAMRLSAGHGIRAAALIGTDLNSDKVREIQHCGLHVVLALDRDATTKAFTLARDWGAAFKSFQVVCLDQDIKDMTSDKIHDMLVAQEIS